MNSIAGHSTPARSLRLSLLAGILVLGAGGSELHAQQLSGDDAAVDVQLFEYASGPGGFLSVAGAEIAARHRFSLDFVATFLTSPFTVYSTGGGSGSTDNARTNVVDQMFAGQLGGAYGIGRQLQLNISVPLVFSFSGDPVAGSSTVMSGNGSSGSGIGDLRVELKWGGLHLNGLRLALIPGLSAPTAAGSDGGDFLGEGGVTGRLRGAAQWTSANGLASLGLNAGVIVRSPHTIYAREVDDQLTYGLGVRVRVHPRVQLLGEAFGRTDLAAPDFGASPLELLGGVRGQLTASMSIVAGGGAGVVKGIGSPGMRMFVSVGWAPDYRDQDHDGVSNASDLCPLAAEDLDGFEDGDGCPDPDNDNDLRDDLVDLCPNQAEDLDGLQDEDGCPEDDADGDGVADASDRCNGAQEDGKAPWAQDGCPFDQRDVDGDGIVDIHDQCPEVAEDFDGFDDEDGCADEDNDGDKIADDVDKCPLCSEDFDGDADGDGCPEADRRADGFLDNMSQGSSAGGDTAAPYCPAELRAVPGGAGPVLSSAEASAQDNDDDAARP